MDFVKIALVVYQFFVANLPTVIDLANRAGALVVDIYALALALAAVLAPFFGKAASAKKALLAPFNTPVKK